MPFVSTQSLTKYIFSFYTYTVVVLLLAVCVEISTCDEARTRALDMLVPSWRPLPQNLYQQFHHGNSPAHLISFSNFNAANKAEVVEVAKHNAHMLKHYKDPITSYNNPFPLHSQTPGPLTTAFLNPHLVRQQQAIAASTMVQSLLQYPGKSAPLYQTKLTFLGKPEITSNLHYNNIHQTYGTTPKIAGYTKENSGKVHLHYHHPSYGMTPISSTTKRIPLLR